MSLDYGKSTRRLAKGDADVATIAATEPCSPELVRSDRQFDAALPQRSFRMSVPYYKVLPIFDVFIACATSGYFFSLTGRALCNRQWLMFCPSWPFRTGVLGAINRLILRFGFNQSVAAHMLTTANGAGWPLATLGSLVYINYNDNGSFIVLAILTTWLSFSSPMRAFALNPLSLAQRSS